MGYSNVSNCNETANIIQIYIMYLKKLQTIYLMLYKRSYKTKQQKSKKKYKHEHYAPA